MSTRANAGEPPEPQPPRPGACLWLTGVSGAGKSTLTQELVPRLHALGRTVTVLDIVPLLAKQPCERTSEGKLLRKAFVAGEIAAHGGLAICVTVSAGQEIRQRAREIVGRDRFVEVYVEVPESVAAQRRAARGRRVPIRRRLRTFARSIASLARDTTGPPGYEVPAAPDVTIDALTRPPEDGAEAILEILRARGVLVAASESVGGDIEVAPGPVA